MKYELVATDTITLNSRQTLTRIRALVDIPRHNVKRGNLGGYIENKENLSQDGDAWVSINARVFDKAQVFGEAKVFGQALVYGNAKIGGRAKVSGRASLGGHVEVLDDAKVFGDTLLSDNSKICGAGKIYGNYYTRTAKTRITW